MERTGALYQYHHGLQDEGRAADLPAGVQRGAAGRPPRHHRTLLQEEGEHGCLTMGFADIQIHGYLLSSDSPTTRKHCCITPLR